MKPSDSRLMSAVRRAFGPSSGRGLTRRRAPPDRPPQRDTRDWQQLIESGLDALNRRLSSIEVRMTLIFYLIVILTITTIVPNADAAQQLLRGVLQIK